MIRNELVDVPIRELLAGHAYAADFFSSLGLKDLAAQGDRTLREMVSGLPLDFIEDHGLTRDQIVALFLEFMVRMEALKTETDRAVESLTILGGHDKLGGPEAFSLTLRPGDIVCIVGPTGSGKSRLLGDIECLAQADTPTGRRILINGKPPETACRFALERKLVAELSQNMNFVMDLTVAEFVAMHAESRMIPNPSDMVAAVIGCANDLAGERFSGDTSVTQLSGGQSRALMIADTALLSASPIVLIDEIENAGVDRKKALELLVRKEKIILISTHDPLLALLGQRRITIRNGGVYRILETTPAERANLAILERIDRKLMELRNQLRNGLSIETDLNRFFNGD
jgi:ABC-type lipoprotein export system ATPase subunit